MRVLVKEYPQRAWTRVRKQNWLNSSSWRNVHIRIFTFIECRSCWQEDGRRQVFLVALYAYKNCTVGIFGTPTEIPPLQSPGKATVFSSFHHPCTWVMFFMLFSVSLWRYPSIPRAASSTMSHCSNMHHQRSLNFFISMLFEISLTFLQAYPLKFFVKTLQT